MTEKLYEKDAYISCFDATVIDCFKENDFYKIVLDKTAFFPEGGGQAADIGWLNNIKVFDVQIQNGNIYHYVQEPIKIGTSIQGKINFDRRFNFMQNHTGEHIVSGIAHTLFGVNNVGFHLGEEFVTIDFDKELTRQQLNEIEYAANSKVWQNLNVKLFCPNEQELKNIEYRSKKEIDGALRLVQIENTDICACCAPHVNKTGEIGIIKLLDFERMRGGVRIILKCGGFALKDYHNKYENIAQISSVLSVKQEGAAQAVKALEQKLNDEKHIVSQLKKKQAELCVNFADKTNNCVMIDDATTKDLQLVADKLYKRFGGIRAALSGEGENYSFAICGDDTALQEKFNEFKNKFMVRGGGRGGMVQGTVSGNINDINLFFKF